MRVDFDPVKIGPKRWRVDPLVVGVIAVVVALAVAVVKPWDAGGDARPPGPSVGAVSPSAAAHPSPASAASAAPIATATVVRPVTARPPTWADLAPIVTTHDAWGVRAILVSRPGVIGSPQPSRYLERWSPTTTDADGGATAGIARDDRSIVALGVTVPRDEMPVDARIWRVHRNDQLEWIDAHRIDSGNADGALLFVRPGVGGSPFEAWGAGHYRIDVLTHGGVRRIAVEVPGPFTSVPPLDDWSVTSEGIIPASAGDPPIVLIGMFATVDGNGVPLGAEPYRLLAEDEAWLDVARTGGVVASVFLPRASGLGVVLPSNASIEVAIMRRLAPDTRFDAPPAQRGRSDRHGRPSFVLFEVPGGGVWAPGVYAISITWTDGVTPHSETWHVELRPGRD